MKDKKMKIIKNQKDKTNTHIHTQDYFLFCWLGRTGGLPWNVDIMFCDTPSEKKWVFPFPTDTSCR